MKNEIKEKGFKENLKAATPKVIAYAKKIAKLGAVFTLGAVCGWVAKPNSQEYIDVDDIDISEVEMTAEE